MYSYQNKYINKITKITLVDIKNIKEKTKWLIYLYYYIKTKLRLFNYNKWDEINIYI